MGEREQVLLEPAYVLHQRPYRDSSQLLECLTANHGRVGLVARGSRRGVSRQRALLQPFVPIRVSWLRRGELGRLLNVEPAGHAHALGGQRLLAAFYASELVLRLTARSDPNAEVFSCYSRCLAQLEEGDVARALRVYELGLLRALGYGLALDCDARTGEPVESAARYAFELETGLHRVDAEDRDAYPGRALISLRDLALEDDESLRVAQQLLGRVLRAHLGERPIKTRMVLQDIVTRGL
jgi:DNA repair protein RecO (recombination protein O)